MRKFCLATIVLIALPAVAQAESCKEMFNGFAADMDRLAAAYEKMTTDREMCIYGRNTAIPTRRRVVDKIEASHCPNTAAMLQFSRDRMRETIATTDGACRKAGM
jgi:hypothetical protein